MIKMLFFILWSSYHVVDVDLYLVMNHVMKQSHHGTLICGANVLQPERHDLVAECAPLCNENSLFHVFKSHFDLIVTKETIHEGENLVLSGVVNQYINMGKWKLIFRTC